MNADLSGFSRQLDRAARRIRRGAERGVDRGAQALADRVRSNAPVDSGALRDSVEVEAGERSRDKVVALVVVEGGHGREPVALDVEYGTAEQAPNPFVRRSVSQEKKSIREGIRASVLSQVPTD